MNNHILAIDGGGFRGRFAAHLLKRIEQEWQVHWQERFCLLAGTSTGAILAAGLACGITAERLAAFYDEHGAEIFRPRFRSRLDPLRIFTSRYSASRLKELLEQTFGDLTLGDLSVPLLLPAVDIDNGGVHVFKSNYHDTFVRDGAVRVSDAVLASCSAPTYFDPHHVHEYRLVDGGLWANNPALMAAIDAQHRLGLSLGEIGVLSVGTGTSRSLYARSKGRWRDRVVRSWQGWGFATRWERTKLLDLILNLQSANAHNQLCLLLGENPQASRRVLRLTFESDQPLPMDSVPKGGEWVARADHVFTHNAQRIMEFLSVNEGGSG